LIVVIDNYDSFTYNLVDYIGRTRASQIQVYRNDAVTVEEIKKQVPECIIISPGPKAPKDAGISKAVIETLGKHIPILGVCLGHQAIGEVFGCEVVRAKEPMHGKTSMIEYRPDPLFAGLPNPFQAARYHSLVISNDSIIGSDEIVPIAYAQDDGAVMAVKHKDFPVYGVQFHPESVYSLEGLALIQNFLNLYSLKHSLA
jgi:anthranilate synthase/aminodeoxychorismate synthase-like glutamine amidotransferase